MCGICGIVSLDGESMVGEDLLRAMNAMQKHRGPDDEGFFHAPGIGLGFCRLAILDLTEAGHQPMTNEDGTIWLVFNGEIYNFQELVPVLEKAGHIFRSHSDSEVILHAYEQWGTDCIQRFNGMFAFAIWDSRKRQIWLARDRLGVKPLYYWSDGKHFAFSSELKSLLALPWIERKLNLAALQSYFVYEYVPAPESIFEEIAKLQPAHQLLLHVNGTEQGHRTSDLSLQCYWKIQFLQASDSKCTLDDYAEEMRVLLKGAVARRLISDVPLGVFLSGGLDSSSIVAMMAEASSKRLKTFSIGFEEKTFNELHYARTVARHFDTEHYEEILRPDVRELMLTVAEVLDEPFADASALPTYLVSRTARKHVTVALAGDGGDELFAGYSWYSAQRIAAATIDRLPKEVRQHLSALAEHIPPTAKKKGLFNTARRFLDGASFPAELQHTRWQTFWHDEEMAQLLTFPAVDHQQTLAPCFLEFFAASGSRRALDQQQFADIKRYLPDDILFKVDRMSMAVSLETRAPFLDYTLAEFAARLPASLRMRGLSGKYLLKRSMEQTLPHSILHRPKLGFNIPYKNWLRHELRGLLFDALSPTRLHEQGLFQSHFVQKLLHEHLEGVRDHSHKLWQLLMFQLWTERYLAIPQTSSLLTKSHVCSS